MILQADTDKPHRCPECWCIPDRIWDSRSGRARFWATYTCPGGHRFARWRRLLPVEFRNRHERRTS